jgi:hydroxypyruvate isomerase
MTFDVGVVLPAVYGDDLVAGIERAAAAGADAVEFFDWESADRAAVREACERHGVSLAGILSAGAGANIMETDAPAMVRPDDHDQCVADIERSVEAAAEFGADALIVTVGQDQTDLDEATQITAVVDVLRAVAPAAESHDVTVVPELLNGRVDHPGYFLQRTARGVELVHAVDSPNVGLLFDVYHQQITEGDVTRRLRTHLDHVGHVHIADNPGRAEPGTGELDYAHVFAALAEAGYEGVVSCEFSPEADPDAAVERVVELADDARGR